MGSDCRGVYRFAPPDHPSEPGVELSGAQPSGRREHWDQDDLRHAGGDSPKSDCALLLDFGMGREILEGKNVAGGERYDRVGGCSADELAKGPDYGQELIGFLVVVNNDGRAALI